MIVLQIVERGGLPYNFIINEKGVAYQAGSAVKKLDRAATIGSAALGSLGGTGAGAIAIAQESNNLSWKEIRYAKVNSRNRAIIFRTKYLIFPVPLYCTSDNFTQVLELVQKYAPGLCGTSSQQPPTSISTNNAPYNPSISPPNTKFCINCDARMPENDIFCAACGKKQA